MEEQRSFSRHKTDMGFDTRYWGPSAWQLLHLIAFHSKHPDAFLKCLPHILPCPFCRESTATFMNELPLQGERGRWMYELHNKVNHKLRTQASQDPAVIDPGPNPSFEDVKRRYAEMKATNIPGRDFLFVVAANFPDQPTEDEIAHHECFLRELVRVYPFETMRHAAQTYMASHPPSLTNHKTFMKWMYGLLKQLAEHAKVPILSYNGFVQRVMYYKSGCAKKTYKGKTCRKTQSGGRTKVRENRITRKNAYSVLLH